MGKLVQVKATVPEVRLPPLNLPYLAYETATLTDAEYNGLDAATKTAIVVVQSGLANPIRSSSGTNPSSALDAYKLSKAYTDEAILALSTVGIDPPAEMATHTEVAASLTTAKHYTDTTFASTQSAIGTAISALRLGTASTHAASDFDPAGAAAIVQAQLTNYAPLASVFNALDNNNGTGTLSGLLVVDNNNGTGTLG